MPRAQTSAAGRITEFFRTAPIDVAEFAYGQVQDILRERKAKSQAAKERAAKGKSPTAAPTAKVAKPKAKKKSHKRKPAAGAPVQTTPLMETYEADAGEAGDLVGVGSPTP